MFFKLTKNAFRDLLLNSKKIATMDLKEEEKLQNYNELYKLLKSKLVENERNLNSQTAFSKRAEHWNQRDLSSIRPVTNMKNPWLRFKREFEHALSLENTLAISVSLAWILVDPYLEDWIND